MLFEMQFNTDALFGLKVCLTIDRSIQLCLQSCQDTSEIEEVNFKYLDFSFDQECIKSGSFSCNPPASILELFQATTPRGHQNGPTKSKLRRRNILSGPGG